MTPSFNFSLPELQNASVQVTLAPATSISGWSIEFDLMWRQNSPQPLVSKYMASGFSTGQSGITLVDGVNGVFSVAFVPAEISGVSLQTGTLAFRTYRTDSGNVTPINGGYRILPPF